MMGLVYLLPSEMETNENSECEIALELLNMQYRFHEVSKYFYERPYLRYTYWNTANIMSYMLGTDIIKFYIVSITI